ncbi:helix-turn-helix domain-containing protein [Lacticaseibacillus suilingensis]|uniref:helix-turn-helix domain-containing protein n=1 Tax=Lacticaseibacillus suilingensis TaxID=2799577 RepID=UPI0022E69CA6|nr:helix-turn-helix transcriptional regulator [Lacticaseibacillus suilingensis]
MDTAQRIAELRIEHKMSQADLANRLSVSPSTVGMWETRKRMPSPDLIKQLGKVFDVSTDYILAVSDKRHYYDLTAKDTQDIAEQAQQIIDGMDTGASVNFYGEPMTEEQKQSMRDILEMGLRINKEKAKKKFTPKKFRGQDGD